MAGREVMSVGVAKDAISAKINPFVTNALFLYPLKTLKSQMG